MMRVDTAGPGNRNSMTTTAVYHLSNPTIEQEFDLTVAEGADVMAAARAHLEESGLYGDMQTNFYISVYPRTPAGSAGGVGADQPEAGNTVGDAGSTDEDAILA